MQDEISLIRKLPGNKGFISSTDFSPDGKSSFSTDGQNVYEWSVETGEQVKIHRLHPGEGDRLGTFRVLPDGRTLVTGRGVAREDKANEFSAYLWRLPESVWPEQAPAVSKPTDNDDPPSSRNPTTEK